MTTQKFSISINGVKLNDVITQSVFTPREMDILRVITMSNKEIGNELNIAESTIKQHVQEMCNKLGVASRTSLAIESVRRGIILIADFKYGSQKNLS